MEEIRRREKEINFSIKNLRNGNPERTRLEELRKEVFLDKLTLCRGDLDPRVFKFFQKVANYLLTRFDHAWDNMNYSFDDFLDPNLSMRQRWEGVNAFYWHLEGEDTEEMCIIYRVTMKDVQKKKAAQRW